MTSPVVSIIIASASSVGKTFLIGVVGFLATKFPRASPLIPPSSLSALSRMTFNVLILPLIYSGVASSVSLSDLESLYPVMIFSVVILAISFLSTVILGYLFGMRKETYFIPLCIASTFPNIVALPIIIFPTLCEYKVVQDLVREDVSVESDADVDLMEVCKKQVNAIVFTYFFGFSVLFWSVGYRALTTLKVRDGVESADCGNAALHTRNINPSSRELLDGEGHEEELLDQSNSSHSQPCLTVSMHRETTHEQRHGFNNTNSGREIQPTLSYVRNRCHCSIKSIMSSTKEMAIATCTSTGFVALVLGFVTSCIGPLQRALFEAGGSLRVLGSALEALSSAGTTFATLIVAASLVKVETNLDVAHEQQQQEHSSLVNQPDLSSVANIDDNATTEVALENGSQFHGEIHRTNLNTSQTRTVTAPPITCLGSSMERETLLIYVWQLLSRLFVTPGIVFAILMEADCSRFLQHVPNIAKLVLLVNAAVPGALVVVVILKAEGFTNEAAAVSKTYLPSYTLSVFTLAMWSSFGLMAFHPETRSCKVDE